MRFLPLILCVLLCSCATKVKSYYGPTLFETQADIRQCFFSYKSAREEIHFVGMDVNHSRPAAEAWHGAGNSIGAIALGAAPFAPGASAALRIAAPLGSGAAQFKAAPVSSTSTPAPTATPKP